jgi:hypothetical protein
MGILVLIGVVLIAVVAWNAVDHPVSRRPGFIERSPNGSDKARWRVRR